MTPENKTLAPRLIKFPGEEEKLALLSMLNTGISPGTTLNPDANNTGGTIPLSTEGCALNEGEQGIEERAKTAAMSYLIKGTYTSPFDIFISAYTVATLAERNRVMKIVEAQLSAIKVEHARNMKVGGNSSLLFKEAIGQLESALTQITNGGTVEGNDGCIGLREIQAERVEQISKHGYDDQHDSDHTVQQLINAAVAYLHLAPQHWPFDRKSFKGHQGNWMAKAGAMIAAAIHLKRKNESKQ